jgi:hypothetical protein
MPPFAFSDDELEILMVLAAPIPPSRRGEFLEAVGLVLAQHSERGDGLANRLGRELQPQFMSALPNIRHIARPRR